MPLIIDWSKARNAVKSAGMPLSEKKTFKGPPNEPASKAKPGAGGRFDALKDKLGKRASILDIVKRAAGVRNPGALAAAIGRKKFGKEKFQEMAAAGRKEAEEKPDTKGAAELLGRSAGFQLSVMPSDIAFDKVAKCTHLPADMLKAAYFVKVAAPLPVAGPAVRRGMSPLAIMLGGAALPWLAAPALRSISNTLHGYPYGGGMFGNRGGFEGGIGGMNPREESDLANLAYRRMATNAQLASIAGRFAAANRMMYPPTVSYGPPGM